MRYTCLIKLFVIYVGILSSIMLQWYINDKINLCLIININKKYVSTYDLIYTKSKFKCYDIGWLQHKT